MSKKSSLPQPTQVELEILHLAVQSDRAYSTTRKMIQVMREKGLVTCDESVRPQLYTAAMSKEKTQLKLLEDLTERAFGGSTEKLVMSLLSAKRVTLEEVQEMQRLIQNAKGAK